MATRLYPIVAPANYVEVLAGVLEGTLEVLNQVSARHPGRFVSDEAFAAWWSELDESARDLEAFVSDGWGRISPRVSEILLEADFSPYCGTVLKERDPILFGQLLEAVNVPQKVREGITGFTWY
ncbi:MAG: hypothetical protein RBS68_05965 [Anaerolineales bacterium]|jgi:hypothetical protein|nr:hypothetical protein [Anaerolineales bacterium]